MPQVRYYTVTQTREVAVRANSLPEAATIAELAFTLGQDVNGSVSANKPRDIYGDTVTRIVETRLEIEDQR